MDAPVLRLGHWDIGRSLNRAMRIGFPRLLLGLHLSGQTCVSLCFSFLLLLLPPFWGHASKNKRLANVRRNRRNHVLSEKPCGCDFQNPFRPGDLHLATTNEVRYPSSSHSLGGIGVSPFDRLVPVKEDDGVTVRGHVTEDDRARGEHSNIRR
jgi:hypothetical protein